MFQWNPLAWYSQPLPHLSHFLSTISLISICELTWEGWGECFPTKQSPHCGLYFSTKFQIYLAKNGREIENSFIFNLIGC